MFGGVTGYEPSFCIVDEWWNLSQQKWVNLSQRYRWTDSRDLSAVFHAAMHSFLPVDSPWRRSTADFSPLGFSAQSVCNRHTEM